MGFKQKAHKLREIYGMYAHKGANELKGCFNMVHRH